jgi:hypothetical protein
MGSWYRSVLRPPTVAVGHVGFKSQRRGAEGLDEGDARTIQ